MLECATGEVESAWRNFCARCRQGAGGQAVTRRNRHHFDAGTAPTRTSSLALPASQKSAPRLVRGRSAAPQPSNVFRPALEPSNECRSTPQPSKVCGLGTSIPACKRVRVVRLWWRVSPARRIRLFHFFSGGHGAATDRLHVGRGHAWAQVGPHPRPVVGSQGPCEGGHADADPQHSRTRRRTAGGIGRVAGTRLRTVHTHAEVVGRLFFRARAPPAIPPTRSSHPPRRPLPPTRPADPSLPPAPPTPPSILNRPHDACEGRQRHSTTPSTTASQRSRSHPALSALHLRGAV